jgi:hypothetical protein
MRSDTDVACLILSSRFLIQMATRLPVRVHAAYLHAIAEALCGIEQDASIEEDGMAMINEFLLLHADLVLYFGGALMLFVHYSGGGRSPILGVFGIAIILTAAIFIVLAIKPEPLPFKVLAAVLVLYGIGLFVILSELLLMGLAKFLTAKRGDKWIKEMDYLYLSIGAGGILLSMNRIEFLTDRFAGTDIVAPLILTTAVVIRFLKTRADIGRWNEIS